MTIEDSKVTEQKAGRPEGTEPTPDHNEAPAPDDHQEVPIIELLGDERLQEELDKAKAEVLLAKADLENYRKRVQRDLQQERRFAAMPLLRDLLPVVDNIGRAIEASEKSAAATGLLEGFRLVAQQIETIFTQHGCQQISAAGEVFDPNLHEAISQMPSTDFPQGAIVQVTQVGYELNDRVVRPSQVIISSGPPAADGGTEDGPTDQ